MENQNIEYMKLKMDDYVEKLADIKSYVPDASDWLCRLAQHLIKMINGCELTPSIFSLHAWLTANELLKEDTQCGPLLCAALLIGNQKEQYIALHMRLTKVLARALFPKNYADEVVRFIEQHDGWGPEE